MFLITCTFSSLSSCLTMARTTSLFPSSHALLNKREKCVNTSYVPPFCQKGKIFIYSCRIFCPLKEELCNIDFFVVLVERVLILIVEASGVCASPQQYHCHLAKKKISLPPWESSCIFNIIKYKYETPAISFPHCESYFILHIKSTSPGDPHI